MPELRVLLVDDSEAFIKAAERFLADICHVDIVGCANSGEQAIEMVGALNPQIVLMDILMGGISGIEAAQHIKQRPTPPFVVLMSLDSDRYYGEQIGHAPIDAFINKSEFTSRIHQVLNEIVQMSASNSNV